MPTLGDTVLTVPLGNDLEPAECVVGDIVGVLHAGGTCVEVTETGDPSVCVLTTHAGAHIVWPGEDLTLETETSA
jgi:hypothetical protein